MDEDEVSILSFLACFLDEQWALVLIITEVLHLYPQWRARAWTDKHRKAHFSFI